MLFRSGATGHAAKAPGHVSRNKQPLTPPVDLTDDADAGMAKAAAPAPTSVPAAAGAPARVYGGRAVGGPPMYVGGAPLSDAGKAAGQVVTGPPAVTVQSTPKWTPPPPAKAQALVKAPPVKAPPVKQAPRSPTPPSKIGRAHV